MKAVFKREFKAYFSTPLGYIVLAVYYFFLGLFFTMLYSGGSPLIQNIYMSMPTIIILTLPIITMRLIGEDRHQKVDQALLTAPVKLSGIVMGKFFAALSVYALCFAPTLIYELIAASYVSVNILSFIYSLIGTMLLGAVLIAVGMFISSLTESSIIAAIITYAVNIFLLLMAGLTSMITVPSGNTFFEKVWAKIVEFVIIFLEKSDIFTAFNNFGEEVLSISNLVYFISIIVVFLFLSVRSLEKRRWA